MFFSFVLFMTSLTNAVGTEWVTPDVTEEGWVALPRGAMGLSVVCDCGISCSYSLTIFYD